MSEPDEVVQEPVSQAPSEYSLPPSPGTTEWVIPEPATGSFTSGWLAVGQRPTLQSIASWAQSLTRQQVIISLVAGAVIALIDGGLSGLIVLNSLPRNTIATSAGMSADNAKKLHDSLLSVRQQAGIGIITGPIFHLALIFLIAAVVALFMPQHFGTYSERAKRALKPLAFVSVPFAAVTAVLLVAANGLFANAQRAIFSVSTQKALDAAYASSSPQAYGNLILTACVIAYGILLLTQASSIGGSINRTRSVLAVVIAFVGASFIQNLAMEIFANVIK
jgi:hypothetical protein